MTYDNTQCILLSDSVHATVRDDNPKARNLCAHVIPTICNINIVNMSTPLQRISRVEGQSLPVTAIDQRSLFYYLFGSSGIIIQLGINDCWSEGEGGLNRFYREYCALVEFIQSYSNIEYIVLVSPINVLNESESAASISTRYRDKVEQVATDKGTYFIDGTTLLDGIQENFYDTAHPNNVGHPRLARNYVTAMQGLGLWPADYAI